jgi:hypothetical protein
VAIITAKSGAVSLCWGRGFRGALAGIFPQKKSLLKAQGLKAQRFKGLMKKSARSLKKRDNAKGL